MRPRAECTESRLPANGMYVGHGGAAEPTLLALLDLARSCSTDEVKKRATYVILVHMNETGQTLHRPLEVADRLAELGLEPAYVIEPLRAGLSYKASLSHSNTGAIHGIGVWDAINSRLRDQLIPNGWIKDEPGNFATTVHPDGSLRIVVLGGDKDTGQIGGFPANQHTFSGHTKKHTKRAIMNNEVILGRQGHFGHLEPQNWPLTLPRTYFLVHHIDLEAGTVQAELSLPIAVAGRFISKWHERIILNLPDDLAGGITLLKSLSPPLEKPIEVEVIEKAQ